MNVKQRIGSRGMYSLLYIHSLPKKYSRPLASIRGFLLRRIGCGSAALGIRVFRGCHLAVWAGEVVLFEVGDGEGFLEIVGEPFRFVQFDNAWPIDDVKVGRARTAVDYRDQSGRTVDCCGAGQRAC